MASKLSLPLQVLVVEDSPEYALIVRRWLEEDGLAQVTLAEDAVQARVAIHSRHWDMMVTDVEMPGASGLDLIQEAKAAYRWTCVLVMTGVVSAEYARTALQNNADGLLFKPFSKEVFLKEVHKLAGQTLTRRRHERRSVLAVGAHPDDVEIGCGGTLSMHAANQDEVTILTLSHGAQGGDAMIRAREAHAAAELLRARLILADLRDTQIPEGGTSIELIQQAIAEVQPTHVYTHSQYDTHQDHRNTHRATMVAARSVGNVYCYQPPSATVEFRPGLFIDISGHMQHKLDAIDAYSSQTASRAYLAPDLIVATARYWGRFAGYVMAEPLEVIRQRGP
ncbi:MULTISPECIES: PIG-L family deacetylase [unclassified Lysobacter]|uniref:PIG-L family deacetylase n=1 Tax=unclassified Lysobacter TaxID=2635362 RepID=UPI001C224A1C|nr:PIG-L family deacetylase [Lysobacter sp. MMG2]MBU8975864.1 response regulator [Lysobacter sp. MMG2]